MPNFVENLKETAEFGGSEVQCNHRLCTLTLVAAVNPFTTGSVFIHSTAHARPVDDQCFTLPENVLYQMNKMLNWLEEGSHCPEKLSY